MKCCLFLPKFKASRLTSDNTVFPDVIKIANQNVTYYKTRVIAHDETVIPRSSVASVSIDSNLFFANITIETFGGNSIKVNGFTKGDANEIVRLLA